MGCPPTSGQLSSGASGVFGTSWSPFYSQCSSPKSEPTIYSLGVQNIAQVPKDGFYVSSVVFGSKFFRKIQNPHFLC